MLLTSACGCCWHQRVGIADISVWALPTSACGLLCQQDYLHLGPVELKLLSIAGTQMPIHQIERPGSAELALKECNPDTWPVTQPMLKKVVTPRPS